MGWRSQFRSVAKEWRRFDAGTLKSPVPSGTRQYINYKKEEGETFLIVTVSSICVCADLLVLLI